jgi:DNA primase large subunit
MFETIFKSSVEADLILVSPRHLFRMPYSLHEKTSLASVVIDKNEIRDFDIKKARPLNLKIKSFYPDSKEEEAKELLLKALDWNEQKEKQEKIIKNNVINSKPITTNTKQTDFKKVIISNPSEEIFPPCIKLILNGVKQDGRKRALFILINFFKSLGLSDVELEKKINTWNEKNYQPLKNGYIQSQVIWFKRNSSMLPPNCDKPHYKDLGVCHPDELCKQIKNPVNYAMKKYFRK